MACVIVCVCVCARCGFRKMLEEIRAKRINPRANYLSASSDHSDQAKPPPKKNAKLNCFCWDAKQY